ncbi:unnamed protein product [Rotaria socialis]|uniref:Uncharacterized protein n=1 Tax=Rotaria socialis TaxID=392032 RepID=A0A817W7T1_9BILA|nr:unnamed protein product [Rotaria socialis]CAF3790435.1 unnamed protein product [Rotaria socialis]CAF4687424.1 unnamed protein product [Rotaria socialis]CAF4834659.1 unnamed protein product [Rotaria socialis]
MSSTAIAVSDIDVKLDCLGSPVSCSVRPYSSIHSDTDTKSVGSKSVGSRTSKLTYSEYPQVRPTNPLYASTFTIRTYSSAVSKASSTATVVERRKKFDPQLPKRPEDWRWFSILCIFLFPPTGAFAFALARKAQIKCKDGFLDESRKLNRRALALCIVSVIGGVTLILGLLFGLDSWPRSNAQLIMDVNENKTSYYCSSGSFDLPKVDEQAAKMMSAADNKGKSFIIRYFKWKYAEFSGNQIS